MNSGKQIFCEGLTELEQKWKSHWTQEDLEVSQKGDGHVLGVNLSEGCRSAAIYNEGKFLTVRWQGDLPNDLLSPDCSQELRNAFFMRALKKEAEATFDTRVSEIVVAADGVRSLMSVQSYRKSATIAGVHCRSILSDVSLAQYVATSPEDSGEDDVVAIISVDKTCVGVSICGFLFPGDYEILSRRGLRLANPLKPLTEIERLYRECRDAAEKCVTKVFICGNSECISSVLGALHEITGLEVQILDDSDTVAARGAAFEGAILKHAVKDASVMFDTCGAALGVELADGSMEELIGQDVQIPTSCSVLVTPMGAETEGLSVNVFEGNHEIAAKNTFIGSLRLPPGVGDCEVEIAADVNKCITVTARRISDGTEVKKTMAELGTERSKNGLFRICGTDLPTAVSEKTSDHCHGEGKHTCGECHGKGKETSPECQGKNENGDQNAHSQQQEKLTLLPIVLTDRKGIGKVLDSIEVSDISSKSSEIVLADLQNRRFTPLGVAVLKRVVESVTLYPCIMIKRSYKKHFEKREIVEERCLLWTKEDEYRVVPDGKERYKPMPNCDREKYADVWDDETFLPLLANKNGEVAGTCKETRLKCETCGGTGVLETTHYRDQNEIAAGTERHREKCSYCEGRGLTGIYKCKHCDGTGYVTYVTKPKEKYTKHSKCYHCDGTGKELGATILKANRKVEDCVESHFSLIFIFNESGKMRDSDSVWDGMDDEMRESCEKVWLPSKVPFVKDFERTLLKVSYKRKEECEKFLTEIEKLPLKELAVKRKIADEYKEIIRLINKGPRDPSTHVNCEDFEFEVKYVLAGDTRHTLFSSNRGCVVKINEKKLPDDRCRNYSDALILEDRGGKGFWTDICYSGVDKSWTSLDDKYFRTLPILREFRNCWKGRNVSHYSGNRRLKDYRESIQSIIQNAQKECDGAGVRISESSAPKKNETAPKKSEKKTERETASTSSKKRWKFVLLGLLFGWFGAHYMYAKRWLMLLLTIGSFATGVGMMNKSEVSQKKEPAQTVQQPEDDASKGNSEAIGAVCLVFWLVMWLGGSLFVKKDGKGNRM